MLKLRGLPSPSSTSVLTRTFGGLYRVELCIGVSLPSYFAVLTLWLENESSEADWIVTFLPSVLLRFVPALEIALAPTKAEGVDSLYFLVILDLVF